MPIKGSGPRLEIVGRARGAPFWMGEWNGEFIVHGIAYDRKDLIFGRVLDHRGHDC